MIHRSPAQMLLKGGQLAVAYASAAKTPIARLDCR